MIGLVLIGPLSIVQSFLASPAVAKTVFLVGDGEFMTSFFIQGPTGNNQFDRTSHLLLEGDDFAVCWVKLLPFDRSARLATIDLMPHPRSSDDSEVTVFSFSEDELVIKLTVSGDKMVNALVGDDP